MLPLQVRVDLGVMAMVIKEYFVFPKAGVSTSEYLVSYPGHLLGKSYHSAEMQSAYSTAPADQAMVALDSNVKQTNIRFHGFYD